MEREKLGINQFSFDPRWVQELSREMQEQIEQEEKYILKKKLGSTKCEREGLIKSLTQFRFILKSVSKMKPAEPTYQFHNVKGKDSKEARG